MQLITTSKAVRSICSLDDMYRFLVGWIGVETALPEESSESSFSISSCASSSLVVRRRSLFFQNRVGVRP